MFLHINPGWKHEEHKEYTKRDIDENSKNKQESYGFTRKFGPRWKLHGE